MNLLDLSDGGYRRFGSAGFAIDNPELQLVFRPSPMPSFRTLISAGASEADVFRFEALASRICESRGFSKSVSIESSTPIFRHRGLGSGTAIALAIAEANWLANGREPAQGDLQSDSGRGGASGLGTHLYFSGGFVIDGGRPSSSAQFLPSSAVIPTDIPTLLFQRPMPDWHFTLIDCPWLNGANGTEELNHFRKNTPLPLMESQKAVYDALFGLGASCIESDYLGFSLAMKSLQATSWKRSEIARYGEELTRTISLCSSLGADAVALSSFGPTLCVLHQDHVSFSKKLLLANPSLFVRSCKGRNIGREVYFE